MNLEADFSGQCLECGSFDELRTTEGCGYHQSSLRQKGEAAVKDQRKAAYRALYFHPESWRSGEQT